MGVPDFCQVELELSTLFRSRLQRFYRRNREQLLPAGVLPFGGRALQVIE